MPHVTEGIFTFEDRIIFCKPAGFTHPYIASRSRGVEYQANFIAADPIVYSVNEHSGNIALPTAEGGFSSPLTSPLASGIISIGGVLLASNAGNTAVAPMIVIYGPVDSPRLRNVTQGKSLEFNISLGADDYLVIDFRPLHKTVMLNGTASRYSSLTLAEWWDLQPGTNEITYAASTYQVGSYALVTWRDGFLTA